MKSKKLLLIALFTVCAVTFAGCGNNNTGGSTTEVSPGSKNISESKTSRPNDETSEKSETSANQEISSQTDTSANQEISSQTETSAIQEASSKPSDVSRPDGISKEEKKPTDTEVNTAYCEVVKQLVEKYDKPHINQSYYSGVAVIKLLDFDGDGVDELYCAYSENNFFADKQEIWQYQDGKAVSVYKGDMNNNGTSVEPFTEILQKDDQCYILVNGVFKSEYSSCEWIGINDNKSYSVSSAYDFGDSGVRTTISIGTYAVMDVIGNTERVMKQLGCYTGDIIDKEEYNRQTGIYNDYIKSDVWRTFSEKPGPRVEELDKIQNIFYDFDGDGTLEMWMKASVSQSMGWPETLSLFCTIKDGKVEQLLQAGECGGELGGDYVTLTYSEDDDKLRIGTFYHARGFGGVKGSLTSYDYSYSGLEKYLEFTGTSYNAQPSECTINGKSVSEEEYRDFTQKYHNLSFDNAESLLFNTPPTTSVKDRLKELKVLT